MPRPLDLAKRADLLDAVTAYLAQNGVADLSLRPLAAALGTSSRMLIYYFGTKEHLIAQALAAARPDLDEILAPIDSPAAFRRAAMAMWKAVTRGSQRQSMQVLLQLQGLAVVPSSPYAPVAQEVLRAWLDPVAEALGRIGVGTDDADSRATLLVSGMRGLCTDLLISGERQRVDRAAARLIDSAIRR